MCISMALLLLVALIVVIMAFVVLSIRMRILYYGKQHKKPQNAKQVCKLLIKSTSAIVNHTTVEQHGSISYGKEIGVGLFII